MCVTAQTMGPKPHPSLSKEAMVSEQQKMLKQPLLLTFKIRLTVTIRLKKNGI